MCGVIGLVVEKNRDDLGRIAAELLETLEYRGYDSTGGAFQGADESFELLKGVGAPSQMVHELGITKKAGHIFCGQVRWATFGAVDELNSQPHRVDCHVTMYGAHNGNVTNCDDLKVWLQEQGHNVLSDNDGEMVVHTIEHCFAEELSRLSDDNQTDASQRKSAMRHAISRAASMLKGSYAATVVDPVTHTMWAIKQGSSLYFGVGEDQKSGGYRITSSDLSSVLQLTRVIVPLSEGDFVEFDGTYHQIYDVKTEQPISREPIRSRLRAKDTALLPQFDTFMEQEISAQESTVRKVVTAFTGQSAAAKALSPFLDGVTLDDRSGISAQLDNLRDEYEDSVIREKFHQLVDSPAKQRLIQSISADIFQKGVKGTNESLSERFVSTESGFFVDLLPMCRDEKDIMALRLLDVMLSQSEVRDFSASIEGFTDACVSTLQTGGRLFVVCCGSSYNAAKAATLFFNEIARTEIVPVLPGEFRGQYSRSLKDGDLIIAISQSGETKDLIDVLNSVIASKLNIARVAIVNNINSTLAQEKCDVVIPLRCGPETAVPATKSFMNQMAVLYCLSLKLAEKKLGRGLFGRGESTEVSANLAVRTEKLSYLPELIRETVENTEDAVEDAAQRLFLKPSIHILATRINAVAKEGALKIREVVLNHTEGFEGSEFKHGPNTILGFNTLYGPTDLEQILRVVSSNLEKTVRDATSANLDGDAVSRLCQALLDSVLSMGTTPFGLNAKEAEILAKNNVADDYIAAIDTNYPLVYITGPDNLDVNLTISALNTHKIRGSMTVVIAEENDALRQAATKSPANNDEYQSVYITLPRTHDTLMTVFSSTVVLQRLALKMSKMKMAYLDRAGVREHGVHPDVPKNVSKSITVD